MPVRRAAGYLATNFCSLNGVYLPPRIQTMMVEEARAAGIRFVVGATASPDVLEAEALSGLIGLRGRLPGGS